MAFQDEKAREKRDRENFYQAFKAQRKEVRAATFENYVRESAERTREKIDNTPAACAWRLAERNRIAESDPENAFQLEFAF